MSRRPVFPVPWFYAVIRMDPLAMVTDLGLDDTETLAEVEMFNPKKYLVYVNLPIGNTLRPEDRKKGLLADMVIPIFPNTQCSSATRPSIRPTPDFPFPNCFHWIDSITDVRVRRPACGFTDDSRAIRLESPQHHATRRTFKQDYVRMDEVLDNEGEEEPVVTRPPAMVPAWALRDPIIRKACCAFDPSQFLRAPRDPVRALTPALDRDSSSSVPLDTSSLPVCQPGDEKPANCVESEKSGELTTAADIFSWNIFGWDPDPTFPLIPLVDLWCELDEHLTAEDIPSPMEWFEEEKRIIS
uniref:Candidapepsin-4 (Aspartate protease 4) (Secreted aspartic protease 4)) n=1 Tax=Ganoderma boninense TaxID=34458 RepID=A0A5K1K727_9APHY|nr:Candidapepsin-4 (EC (ACP 4) (Aspartate protease 4) (Secreted aspartic protease 4) [Ganoderma boninense]